MTLNRKIRPLTNTEISLFCQQISLMINAGISAYESVLLLSDDAQTDSARKIYSLVLEKLEVGESLYTALKHSQLFPKYMLDMVKLGEMSGHLDEVLMSLSHFYEREKNISQSIRRAITYPLMMIVILTLILLVMIVKVLPVFSNVYQQLGSDLSSFSLQLLHFGISLTRYTSTFLIIFVLFILFIVFLFKSSAGKKILNYIYSNLLFTKNFRHNVAASRFASGLALALESGIDIDQGMELTASLVDNPDMQKKIHNCRDRILSGENLSQSLVASGIFSPVHARMISIGFKSGSIEQVMNRIAADYEDETDDFIRHFLSILEPSLVILFSILVGLILLSVMLPLLGIMASLG